MLEAVTGRAALVDRSERGKLSLAGEEAAPALNGIVSNEVEGLEPGSGVLAAVLTPKGRMLGDLRVLRTDDELLLDMERVALQPVFDALRHGLVGYRAELGRRTLQQGLLSLLGPGSRAVAGAERLGEAEHSHVAASLAGTPVRLIATDLGVDVLFAAEDLDPVRAELLARGAVEAGEDEAELLRVESGRPRYGVDLDDSVIPQEAGLNDRVVSFTKGCYVGQELIVRVTQRGGGRVAKKLVGLALDGDASAVASLDGTRERSAPASGAPIHAGDRAIGHVTSAVFSPRLGRVIALGYVHRDFVSPGTHLEVLDGAMRRPAVVTPLPFVAPVA